MSGPSISGELSPLIHAALGLVVGVLVCSVGHRLLVRTSSMLLLEGFCLRRILGVLMGFALRYALLILALWICTIRLGVYGLIACAGSYLLLQGILLSSQRLEKTIA